MPTDDIFYLVSINGYPVVAFKEKKDAIKYCTELWAESVTYMIKTIQVRL